MIITDSEYIELSIQHETYMLIVYKQFCPSKIFRAFWEQMPERIFKYDTIKFLVDLRNIGAISPKDQKWFSEEIGEKTRNLLNKVCLAVIAEENTFAKTSMDSALKYAKDTAPNFERNIKYFDNLKDAENWLLNAH